MSSLKEQKQTPSEKLASAAEELAKAAACFDDTASFQGAVDAINHLKASTDAKLNTSNQKIGDLNNTVSQVVEKIGTWNTKMEKLNSEVVMMNQNLVLNRKMESLAWAIDHVESKSFQYVEKPTHSYETSNTKTLARDVLLAFRSDMGCYLPDVCRAGYGQSAEELEKVRKEFRDKFSDQIHALTGVKPRLVLNEQNQKYIIYFE
jgi:chromosome segregation ATPase